MYKYYKYKISYGKEDADRVEPDVTFYKEWRFIESE